MTDKGFIHRILRTHWIILQLADSKNPAFVLSDSSLKFNEKTLFILSQKWCWGLIFLAITLILFLNSVMIMFIPKHTTYITLPPDFWGAEDARPGLKELILPVDKVVVTDTGDYDESCSTKVLSRVNLLFASND